MQGPTLQGQKTSSSLAKLSSGAFLLLPFPDSLGDKDVSAQRNKYGDDLPPATASNCVQLTFRRRILLGWHVASGQIRLPGLLGGLLS